MNTISSIDMHSFITGSHASQSIMLRLYSPSSKLLNFTHQCNIVGGITDQNALYDQALANFKPGGLYKAQEFNVGFSLETGLSRTRL